MSSSRHHNISILRPSLSLHCPHPNRLSLASLTASPKHLTCAVALLSYTSSPEKNLIICCLLDLQLWSLSCSHHGLLINCINPQKETVKRNTPDMFSSNRTHIRTHLHFIKLSLCRSLCAFVMFTETHTVLVLLNQTKRQTDWLSVSPLEIQTECYPPDMTRGRGGSSDERATVRRARAPDKQMEREETDLCGGWELTYTDIHRVTSNKCHPRVRWRDPAGPAAGSLACASFRNRCCFPAPHSRHRRPSG